MKNLTLLVLAVSIALIFFKGKTDSQKEVLKVAISNPPMPAPNATLFCAKVPEVTVSDLFSLQGTVERITPEGIIFKCEEWIPPANPWMNYQADASAGAAEIQQMARLAAQNQQTFETRYGRLLTVKNGILNFAEIEPTNQGNGTVLLVGLPHSDLIYTGKRMRFVAASTGQTFQRLSVYSVYFQYKNVTKVSPRRGIGL